MYICKARELYGEELDDGSESFRYLTGELKTNSENQYTINDIIIKPDTITPIRLQLNNEQRKILFESGIEYIKDFDSSFLHFIRCMNNSKNYNIEGFEYMETILDTCFDYFKKSRQLLQGI